MEVGDFWVDLVLNNRQGIGKCLGVELLIGIIVLKIKLIIISSMIIHQIKRMIIMELQVKALLKLMLKLIKICIQEI